MRRSTVKALPTGCLGLQCLELSNQIEGLRRMRRTAGLLLMQLCPHPAFLPHHAVPEKYCTSRVFAWQEKVYSRSEVATAQVGHGGQRPGAGAAPGWWRMLWSWRCCKGLHPGAEGMDVYSVVNVG